MRRFMTGVALATIGLLLIPAGIAQAVITAPTDIPGSVLWLDASDPATVIHTTNPGFVEQWSDKSAVGTNHFTQTNLTYKPVTGGATLNGLNVLTLDGGDDHLLRAGPSLPLGAGDDNYTYLAVWQPHKISGIQSVYEQGSGTNQRASLLAINDRYGFNGQNNDRHDLVPFGPNQWRLTDMEVDNADFNNIRVYDNTGYFQGRTGNPSTLSVGTSGSTVGKKEAVFGEFLDGDLAEVIVYDRVLSGPERNEVGQYLSDKYNLAGNHAPGGLAHQWKFNDLTADDSVGTADGALSGGTSVASDGRLEVDGNAGSMMRTSALGHGTGEKTLMVWTSLRDHTDSTAGSALTLQNDATGNVFDGVVYGERTPQQWMAGSNGWVRSDGADNGGGLETVSEPGEAMIAIAYGTDDSITLYRNGTPYASYTQDHLVGYDANAVVQIGPRHGNHVDVYDGFVNEARVYNYALGAAEIQAAWQAGIEPTGLIHHWTFNTHDGTSDLVGTADGTLFNGATLTTVSSSQGVLRLDGVDDYMRTSTVDNTITEKTLVAWATLDNLSQRSGGVLTLENPTDADVFDSITYGERTAQQWMNGSNGFVRSDGANNGGALETSLDELMMAITYESNGDITIYREGELYTSYNAAGGGSPFSYTGGIADVLMGLRHEDLAGGSGTPGGTDQFWAGWINEAQIYDHALTLSEVRYLFNQGPAPIPEPATMVVWAFGLALLGLATAARRRRR